MRKPVVIVVLSLIPVGLAHAQIPAAERAALVALYNSTDGPNWTNTTNWLGPPGTECTWYGVTCGMGGYVSQLWLSNGLKGAIPPELGNLSGMNTMDLSGNQLSGSIPPELENLSSLRYLYLGGNDLSGSIPPELGNLSTLWYLSLHTNHLIGTIPPELGSLPELQVLYLNANQLRGEIPTSLENLTTLSPLSLDIGWNALHTDIASLDAFIASKHAGFGDWKSSQTIAPANVTVDSVGDHTVWVSWGAVTSPGEASGYELFFAPTGSVDWKSIGWTDSIWSTSFPATGLDPATSYEFVVTTFTEPHLYNLNLVESDPSQEVTETTTSTGCTQPVIRMAGTGPYTLSLSRSYESYEWSTGETTASIVVNPPPDAWFWVTVTSGACEEAAAILVNPEIFADGFESGDTAIWSNAVP